MVLTASCPREVSGSSPKEPGPVGADCKAETDHSKPERDQRRGIKGNDGQANAESSHGGGQCDETRCFGYVQITPRQPSKCPSAHHRDQDRADVNERYARPSDDQPQVRFRLGYLP
jgi:hypothetical protein